MGARIIRAIVTGRLAQHFQRATTPPASCRTSKQWEGGGVGLDASSHLRGVTDTASTNHGQSLRTLAHIFNTADAH